MGLEDRLRRLEERAKEERIPIPLDDGSTFYEHKDKWIHSIHAALYGKPNSLVDAAVETDTRTGFGSVLTAIVRSRELYYGSEQEGASDGAQ